MPDIKKFVLMVILHSSFNAFSFTRVEGSSGASCVERVLESSRESQSSMKLPVPFKPGMAVRRADKRTVHASSASDEELDIICRATYLVEHTALAGLFQKTEVLRSGAALRELQVIPPLLSVTFLDTGG